MVKNFYDTFSLHFYLNKNCLMGELKKLQAFLFKYHIIGQRPKYGIGKHSKHRVSYVYPVSE